MIRLILTRAPTETVRMLVSELDADLRGEGYDPCQQHGYTLENIFKPDLNFYVAYAGDEPAGCGGVQFLDGFAELKRMYVRPVFRGAGASVAIIRRLEADAAAQGLNSIRLETGVKQHAALRFYAREGFRVREAFPPYTELDPFAIATSVFMEKRF